LGLIEMPVVPVSEQKAVLRILNQQSEAISRRVSLVERSRTLLEERRRALITAAVTGQLDIPEAA
jgi:type I restriction enzyme S subunit